MESIEEEEEQFKGFSKNAIRVLNVPECNSKMSLSHYNAMSDMYSDDNKTGYISLSIAENLLSFDFMKDKLICSKNDSNFNQSITQYAELGGMKSSRESIANNLLQNKLFKYKPINEQQKVKSNQIVMANGATPLLENIFNMFCNQDEYAIIPSPLFGNFIPFAFQRFGIKVLPAKSEIYNEQTNQIIDFEINFKEFDRLYNQYKRSIKLVVICNPNNPNGFIFHKKQIKKLVEWCRIRKIHLVSDEIYALSIFNSGDNLNEEEEEEDMEGGIGGASSNSISTNSFSSIYDICQGDMGEYVHLVSSFSKDFALNGYRAGYFFSQNKTVLKYMLTTSTIFCCSNIVQSAITSILNDTEFLNSFVTNNQKKLLEAYTFTTNTLQSFNIPFIKSSSGLFITIDLRKCLPYVPMEHDSNTCPFAKEIKLWELLYKNKVIITCGKSCYFSQPGYFRLIFTLSNDVVYNGIKRISEIYNKLLC